MLDSSARAQVVNNRLPVELLHSVHLLPGSKRHPVLLRLSNHLPDIGTVLESRLLAEAIAEPGAQRVALTPLKLIFLDKYGERREVKVSGWIEDENGERGMLAAALSLGTEGGRNFYLRLAKGSQARAVLTAIETPDLRFTAQDRPAG